MSTPEVSAPLAPPDRPAGNRPPGGRPARGLLIEGLAVWVTFQALTVAFFEALRTRGATFYQDVLIAATGPEKFGMSAWLRDGILPIWARDQYLGEPFAANLQHGLFYPGNLPFWLFKTSIGLKLTLVAHIAFAAVAMWAFCRIALRTGSWGAVVAGLAYGFGGSLLQHIILISHLQVMAWIPVMFLFAHLALETRRVRFVVLTAVAIGMEFLSGHPEWWLYSLVALALYAIAWTFGAGLRAWGGRAVDAVVRLGGAAVMFCVLFAWQLLPTLLLQRQGYRTAPSFREQYPLPKDIALNALLPDYGRVLVGENVGFIGIVALALAGLGIAAGRRELRWVRGWAFGAAALGMLMAVGAASPIYRFVYDNVSLARGFRVPSRWLLLPYFSLAMMAALGMDVLLRGARDGFQAQVRRGLGGIVALAALAGVVFTVGRLGPADDSIKRWGLAAIIGLLAWALAAVPWVPRALLASALLITAAGELKYARPSVEYRQVAPSVVYDDPGPVLSRLARDGGRYVTIGNHPRSEDERNRIEIPGWVQGQKAQYFLVAWPLRLAARPSSEYSTHVETPLGRDGGLLPLRTYHEFFTASAGTTGRITAGVYLSPPSRWNFEMLNFLGIEWFVAGPLEPSEEGVLAHNGFTVVQTEAYIDLWRREALPIARMHYDLDVVAGRSDRIDSLRAGYPLTTRAMVEEPIGPFTRPASEPRVVARHVGSMRVEFEVTTATPGLLVVADPWYPQWRAAVDGRPAGLHRVDHAFRGVVVPAGRHVVTFVYRDRATLVGVVLAGVTVLVLGIAGRRRRRQTEPVGPG